MKKIYQLEKQKKKTMKKRRKNKEKIMKAIDKIATPLSIILFAFLVIALIIGLINQFTFEKKITHPTKEEVEETCYRHNMIPESYTINYQEEQIYINCKIGYVPPHLIKKPKKVYWTKKCCYPTNCPESKNNPENCDCTYPIYCFNPD